MNDQPASEFLLLSRGQWDAGAAPEVIQESIDQFYDWLERLVAQGKMRKGQRLGDEGRTVGRKNLMMDGPFGETKEVVGGYWFIIAGSLEEAAELAAQSPTLKHGIFYEIRPIVSARCDAFAVTAETPAERRVAGK